MIDKVNVKNHFYEKLLLIKDGEFKIFLGAKMMKI